jgi:hypothetical protein
VLFNYVPVGHLAQAGQEHEQHDAGRERDAPAAFGVGVMWAESNGRRLWSHGRGTLLISPGTVGFSPSPWTRRLAGARELSHTSASVTLTTARVSLPWSHAFLILDGDGARARVAVSVIKRGAVLRALKGAGITVEERSSRHPPRLAGT